jgi:hypothetical protein
VLSEMRIMAQTRSMRIRGDLQSKIIMHHISITATD